MTVPWFLQDTFLQHLLYFLRLRAAAHQFSQVTIHWMMKTKLQFPFRCHPDTVALVAETAAHRADKANASFEMGIGIIHRRAFPVILLHLNKSTVNFFQPFPNGFILHWRKSRTFSNGHHFDKTYLHGIFLRQFCQMEQFFFIFPCHRHTVDFHRQSHFAARYKTCQSVRQYIPSSKSAILLRIQTVNAYIDAGKPCFFQFFRKGRQMDSIACHNYFFDARNIGNGFHQFHDILPGSSIEKVYEDSMEQYEQVLASDAALIGDAQNALAALVRADGDGVLVFNQLGFARDALVRVPVEAPVAGVLADGRPLPFRWADGELCFVAAELPAKGWRHYRFAGCASAPVPFAQVSEDGRRITTPFYEAELDACGAFTRLYDIAARREVLKPGARGNVFQMFEDRPDNYDAWNLEQYYSEHMWELDGPAELSVEENSAVRCCVLVKRAFSRSAMEQRIVFYPHTRRIDFITHVDWHEEHALLKAAFPVDVYATRARYDIQFGSIERDTHRNTSWDAARFEVCAHKWADLSEAGYGVALLNDCKYGCDIHDGVMRLSLLRAPTHPNPNADRGAHTFTYALLPHEGDYRTGGVVREGYALNCPAYARPLAAQDGPLPESYSFVSVDAPGVVVEAVKRAEDGNGIIVRLYEAWGMRTRAVLSVPGSTRAVTPCTAMEDACGEAAVPENGGIPFQIRPFEFKTFRIELA